MWTKIGLGIVGVLALFLGYVATRDGHFHYERSGVIQAPAEKLFPLISSFEKAKAWNPYDQKDPNMKRTLTGTDGQVGARLAFEGNNDVGAGDLELLKVLPNQSVEIRLTMTKPMAGQNLVRYTLTPEGTGTRFTWSMEGDGGFLGKLITVLIDCEKMVAGDFEVGIAQLKKLAET